MAEWLPSLALARSCSLQKAIVFPWFEKSNSSGGGDEKAIKTAPGNAEGEESGTHTGMGTNLYANFIDIAFEFALRLI